MKQPEHCQTRKSGRPFHLKTYQPRLIAWEITRRCELNCKHCRASAQNIPYLNELSSSEIKNTLKNIASHFNPIIILTGGDPLLRQDVFEIASYGTELGLKVVMAPCGQLIDSRILKKMLASGISRLSYSIDGADASSHDAWRGVQGSFDSIMRAITQTNQAGMPFQINTTITRENLAQLPHILELARDLHAIAFHPFLLVPTGRAKEWADLELSPDQYEETLNWIYEQKIKTEMEIKPTCAPHFYRIFRQREKEAGRPVSRQSHGMAAMSKGCLGGQSFAFISHTGRVQICGFLELECGDIRQAGYDFKKIWDHSRVFQAIRRLDQYQGKCGICEYRSFCGGCRARAYAAGSGYLGEEPFCSYQPGSSQHLT